MRTEPIRGSIAMKFVAVSEAAIDRLITDRFMQSIEFSPGRALQRLICFSEDSAEIGGEIGVAKLSGGTYISTFNEQPQGKVFVIDI